MTNNQEIHWYPIRVCYSNRRRIMELSRRLEEHKRHHYIPMEYVQKGEELECVPALVNIIFIHSSQEDLQALKQQPEFQYFRFIMRPVPETRGERKEVIWVPDPQMEDFIRVTSERNERVLYLNNLAFALRPGAHVRVKDGPFAGVTGIVKSIQKHLCVVLPVGGVVAVAILNIPKKSLIYLPQEDKTIKIQ